LAEIYLEEPIFLTRDIIEYSAPNAIKKPGLFPDRVPKFNSGGVLLSHAAARIVSSALRGLTSEFGMGSGVAPVVWPPKTLLTCQIILKSEGKKVVREILIEKEKMVKPHGLLVPVS
jgi:hypothetical protein